jgi:ATP-dependent DNA helicase DinG
MSDRRSRLEELLGPNGTSSRVHPRWEARPQQLEMSKEVFQAFDSGSSYVAIEAPTGVGKTIAYLVPAFLSDKRVLISTNTKTLQDQIINKDLPFVARLLGEAGIDVVESDLQSLESAPNLKRFSVMKGRANYLCVERLERKGRQSQLPLAKSRDGLLKIIEWSSMTGRGDKSELAWLRDEDPQWGDVDARSDICLGRNCARYDDCFVVRMRRRAALADVIIVNHHLLMADLSMRATMSITGNSGFGEVIPSADVLLIDEAHSLEEIASMYFGGEVSSRKIERLVKDTDNWILTLGMSVDLDAVLRNVTDRSKSLFAALPNQESRTRFDNSERSLQARTHGNELIEELEVLARIVENKADSLDPTGESIARRVSEISNAIRFVLEAKSDSYVYWSERNHRNSKLGASPIEVSQLLTENLFSQFSSVVMTSATLATKPEDGFKYFLDRVGSPPETSTVRLGTPFDFRAQSALFIPPELPEPDQPEYEASVAKIAKSVIDLVGGGALFLFTSKRVMKSMHRRLLDVLDYPVFMQGDAPKSVLLERFVAEAPAVLFATASFWEGVDIPGVPLQVVLIDRLPFASPGDPIVSARCERIETQGKSAFAKYQVPQAILRFKQGFGRLIRSTSDRGVVVVCDSRIKSRSYGRRFLKALPDAQRISDLGHLAVWLGQNSD